MSQRELQMQLLGENVQNSAPLIESANAEEAFLSNPPSVKDTGCGPSGSGTNNFPYDYYNRHFAHYDAICGQTPEFEVVNGSKVCQDLSKRKEGEVWTENGEINIKVPLVYMGTCPPPASDGSKVKDDGAQRERQRYSKQNQTNGIRSQSIQESSGRGSSSQTRCSSSQFPASRQSSKERNRPSVPNKENGPSYSYQYDINCPPVPPFCSTVKNIRGPPRKGYITPPNPPLAPDCAISSQKQGKAKTSMAWDYDAGARIPVSKTDYGEELYEKAVSNLLQKISSDKIGPRSQSRKLNSQSASEPNLQELFQDNCKDFSKPGFRSSNRISTELSKAMYQLNRLPEQMEQIFISDSRFEPIVNEQANKVLNASPTERVFKDLVPLEANDIVKHRVTKCLSNKMKSVRPPNRVRDPEPNLLDYQQLTFSRIRPKPPLTNSLPPIGQNLVDVDISCQTENQISDAQRQFEEQAKRMP